VGAAARRSTRRIKVSAAISGRPVHSRFLLRQSRLIIELDGGQHAEQRSADEWRSRILNERGYRVLRFWNDEVLTDMDGVLKQIVAVLGERRW
jgi:very-short-patch-repair endonuclease